MALFKDALRTKTIKAISNSLSTTKSKLAENLFAGAPGSDLAAMPDDALAKGIDMAADGLKSFKGSKAKITIDGNIVQIINADVPFIVDSVLDEITSSGLYSDLVLHPVFDQGGKRLSLLQIHFSELDSKQQKKLKQSLTAVMADVNAVVGDWAAMNSRTQIAIDTLKEIPSKTVPTAEVDEAVLFLEWLTNNHFIFMGIREYVYEGSAKKGGLKPASKTGLGLLHDPELRVLREGSTLVTMSPEIREFLHGSDPLIITKAGVRSRVHRHAHLDYIGVKQFDAKGNLAGELRIVGLFTSNVYHQSALDIPILRKKASAIVEGAGLERSSHSGKALINVLDSYPRDELFQIDQDQLGGFAHAILQLDERPRLRVLARADKFNRFVSCLVYVPRDRYTSDSRAAIGEYLAEKWDGRVSAFYPAFPEGSLARVHFIIGRDANTSPDINTQALETDIGDLVETWDDKFAVAAAELAESNAQVVTDPGFGSGYKNSKPAIQATKDARVIASLNDATPMAVKFYHRRGGAGLGVKLFHKGQALPLSRRVPVLEHFGFEVVDETTFDISNGEIHLHEMSLELAGFDGKIDKSKDFARLENAFLAVWTGAAESDGYNELVLAAKLDWRMASVFRAYSLYLRQTKSGYSQDYLWGALGRHTKITSSLWNLFQTRFDPAINGNRDKLAEKFENQILNGLQDVESIDDDAIIRRFLNAITSTLRTNYYQHEADGSPRKILAFKVDPHALTGLPEPKPYREIWVYSPLVEGVHLRFGPVARGGLRWSDRAQDFRTEVLGLVKAQQVKNAVIVPVGSKGGFYAKQLPDMAVDRNAWFEAGRDAYKAFIRTLLSVTDNLDQQKLLPPANTIRHDGDDPYFVVAADKGTATFSDTANEIAQSVDFWLDDAFASGGSAGYDHKKMGITARGGWEAVKRHFREMDHDIQTQPFTTVGVGDMSGDVYGNGMLLSEQTKVIAAFDHRDIFIDPDPNVKTSFKERKRLFDMGRSSWQDYNEKLLSKGGMIVSKREKQIKLTPEAQAAIGLKKSQATPNEVLTAILKADVDLMWFGGIGTYIRADFESDADVGDKANDPIRITAKEVRAKVIGEGANLGATQKARIAFNHMGGRCNSDAIDNSAGVNSSDVEVNIKIALASAMRGGKLTRPKRNVLLEKMTTDVAQLVLRNNYQQTLAITQEQSMGIDALPAQARFMQTLEKQGQLQRDVEDLPDDIALAERADRNEPLTRAEIGVLLAYSKIILFEQIIDSNLPDDPSMEKTLVSYFPAAMQKPYGDEISNHRLRREIIATLIANSIINRTGPTFLHDMVDRTGAAPADITKAYLIARDANDLQSLNSKIDQLDNQIPWDLQARLYSETRRLVQRQTKELVRDNAHKPPIDDAVETYQSATAIISKNWKKSLPDYMLQAWVSNAEAFQSIGDDPSGVSNDLAIIIAGLRLRMDVPDIVAVARATGAKLELASNIFYRVTETFKIGMIEDAAEKLKPVDFYDGLALDRALQSLGDARRMIAIDILKRADDAGNPVEHWLDAESETINRIQSALAGIVEGGALADISVSRLSVVSNFLADLAKGAAS